MSVKKDLIKSVCPVGDTDNVSVRLGDSIPPEDAPYQFVQKNFTRNELCDYSKTFEKIPLSQLKFWSITIPPEQCFKVRGKPKMYKTMSIPTQHYVLSHMIECYPFQFMKKAIILFEHNKTGTLHIHILSAHDKNDFYQNVKSEIMHVFEFDYKKFNDKLNIVVKPVTTLQQTISYLFKSKLTSHCDDLESWNKMIESKQYEISTYFGYYL